jgi:hypothetical protein
MDTKEGIFAVTLRELALYLYQAYCEQVNRIKDCKPRIDWLRELKALMDKKNTTDSQVKSLK